ncbi:MAG: molybdopterin cofactor-binding domain-containing protein [Casimicrobiaceae bacterium]
MNAFNRSRRAFLQVSAAAGGALCLELVAPTLALGQGDGAGAEVNAWVVVKPDDTVVIRIARSEMGQGSSTGLPMLVAEELQCDWSKVAIEFVTVTENLRRNRAWGNMSTGGSRSVRESQEYLRKAGATAREMLVAAASGEWGVSGSECRVANGIITHPASGRRTTFGAVASAAAKLDVPKDVKLKDPKDWTLIGKAKVARFDLPDKIRGKPVYGIDVELPGMLYASLAQCPVFGGSLKSVDRSEAQKLRGVKRIIELPDAVAVVADNWWRANQALKALKIEWDDGGKGRESSDTILQFLKAGQAQADVPSARKSGDVAAAFSRAAQTIEAEYFTPYLNHATLEPQNCTAWFHDEGGTAHLDVWAPTQSGEASAAAASGAGGVPLLNVDLTKTQLGGGFGRRGASQDFVKYAVAVAKEVPGTPVKTLWSREEDMQHDAYRPISLTRMKASLDASGLMTGWYTKIACSSIIGQMAPQRIRNGLDTQACGSFADSPYTVPNQQVDYAMRNTHVPVGFWRSVYHSQNPFFRECFLDEVAHAAGKDPYEFRRTLLQGERAKRDLSILDTVAKAAGWGRTLPAGVHRGIAVADAYGSYTAGVVEVAVDSKNRIALKRVVIGVDPGYVVDVDAAKAQIEGGIIFALSAIVYGEITLADGRVTQRNFNDYRMLFLRDAPVIEAVLAPTGGFWGGMGEPPMASVAPALVNALAAATGKRVRALPLVNAGYSLATSA